MKGIIFAGGNGTRLHPTTIAYSKQLVNVYDKPAIYYPIATLLKAGIKDILIITTKDNYNLYKKLLQNGKHLGISIKYRVQKEPNGCAEALKLCKSFVKDEPFCVIMGDNVIIGQEIVSEIRKNAINFSGAQIFCCEVNNPKDYGVLSVKNGKIIKIEEKPKNPTSNLAIMGIYIYDKKAFHYAKSISVSERNELEIPDINKCYLKDNALKYMIVSSHEKWMDIGTPENLLIASNFIHDYQTKNKTIIACLEEISYRNNYISFKNLQKLGSNSSEYKRYVLSIKENKWRY